MDTSLEPLELLEELLSLESHWGRIRGNETGQALAAARTLDLDLIWMEGRTSDGARLSLPHPRASGRAFVLGPLLDLEPWLGERLQLPTRLQASPAAVKRFGCSCQRWHDSSASPWPNPSTLWRKRHETGLVPALSVDCFRGADRRGQEQSRTEVCRAVWVSPIA